MFLCLHVSALDIDIAGAIADEFGYKVTNEKQKKEEKHHEDAGVSLPRFDLESMQVIKAKGQSSSRFQKALLQISKCIFQA